VSKYNLFINLMLLPDKRPLGRFTCPNLIGSPGTMSARNAIIIMTAIIALHVKQQLIRFFPNIKQLVCVE
jgi:hypothetical protein